MKNKNKNSKKTVTLATTTPAKSNAAFATKQPKTPEEKAVIEAAEQKHIAIVETHFEKVGATAQNVEDVRALTEMRKENEKQRKEVLAKKRIIRRKNMAETMKRILATREQKEEFDFSMTEE